MKYNFDEIIDRSNTNALNTDGWRSYIFGAEKDRKFPYEDDEFVRMWVADMEFATAPPILDAIRSRLDRRILGYTGLTTDGYSDALSAWCCERYGWDFPREQLVITAGVEKEWDAALVRPFLWKFNGGQCSLEEFGYMHDNKLTEDFAISVKPGEYHRFGYETDGKQIRLYVDGEFQKEISIPYGPAFVSVVTDTKDEIIIKAVNFAGDVDPVSITLDCQVQGDYTVTLLSGEKGDENSFEEPEKVKNITVNMHGASSEFVYKAPPYSVSVLRLKKCEAF